MPKNYKELEAKYHNSVFMNIGEKICFSGVGEKDVYNITPPMLLPTLNGTEEFIVGRVENRSEPLDSEIVFFRKNGFNWTKAFDMPIFQGEDPYVRVVHGGQIILEMVELENGSYRTAIYIGKKVEELNLLTYGPLGMKDIRVFERRNGKVGVFTRPQGRVGGLGTIGYFGVSDLKHINEDSISQARLLENMFLPEEWGGVNFPFETDSGVGFIGYIARYDPEGARNYAAIRVDHFDPDTFEFSEPAIIATRKQFPRGPAKRPDLIDVIFPGGLHGAYLYCGYSDTEAGKIRII